MELIADSKNTPPKKNSSLFFNIAPASIHKQTSHELAASKRNFYAAVPFFIIFPDLSNKKPF